MGERIKVQGKYIDIPTPHDEWGCKKPVNKWVGEGFHDLIDDMLENGGTEGKIIKGLWKTGQVIIYPSDFIVSSENKTPVEAEKK